MELKPFPPPFESTCDSCNGPIVIYTHFQCVVYVCPSCGQSHTFRDNKLQKRSSQAEARKDEGYIPLGSTGVIKKRLYRVVGLAIKKEKGTTYCWREYLLFNPYYGYAFLAEYDGHWSFLEQLIVHPREVVIRQDLAFDRKWFRFFNKYKAVLVYVKGEFCYDVFGDSLSHVLELISPPYVLSYERTSNEQMWFSGEYVDKGDVKKIFALEQEPPEQIGIGMSQPMKASFNYSMLMKMTAAFFGLLIVLQIWLGSIAKNTEVLSDTFALRTDSSGKMIPLVSKTFEITNGPTNIEMEFRAGVENSWMEFAADLVNETTSEHFEFNSAVEYYFGYDGGERWTEGSQSSKAVLSQLPNGKYHINIWPQREKAQVDDFSVNATIDYPMYSNMFLIAGIIAVFPLITHLRRKNFEVKRWSNSNYSPYE
jgi:predicted RNA-binding Zn-ribbon protein involved in translation (DUF1610 family)